MTGLAEKAVAKAEECPFCAKADVSYVTDCFDKNRVKICELWFCHGCGGFFPRSLDVQTLKPEPRVSQVAAPAGEKRRSQRFPVQFVVQIDFDQNDDGKGIWPKKKKEQLSEPLLAMVINAGTGGLCFRYPDPIEEGREGRMKISLPSVAKSFYALGRVVRSTLLPDGSFGLGIEFIDVDPEYRDALKRYVSLS